MNLQTVKESRYIVYPDLDIVKERYPNLYKQIECLLSLKMIGFWKNNEFPNFLYRFDEDYIWPQGLFHYVKIHNVDLPLEFINHILKK